MSFEQPKFVIICMVIFLLLSFTVNSRSKNIVNYHKIFLEDGTVLDGRIIYKTKDIITLLDKNNTQIVIMIDKVNKIQKIDDKQKLDNLMSQLNEIKEYTPSEAQGNKNKVHEAINKIRKVDDKQKLDNLMGQLNEIKEYTPSEAQGNKNKVHEATEVITKNSIATLPNSYVFTNDDKNCKTQQASCKDYVGSTNRKLIYELNSIGDSLKPNCNDKKSNCYRKHGVTRYKYHEIKECEDIEDKCHDKVIKYEEYIAKAYKWQDLEFDQCKIQYSNCVEKEKSNKVVSEAKEKHDLIVSLSKDNDFKYFTDISVIDGFDKIKFGFSEDELKTIDRTIDLNDKKRRVRRNSDSRTSKELIGNFGSSGFALYDNFYPVLGKNRQIGILYNSDGMFAGKDLQQININLSGEDFSELFENLQNKYQLNGHVKFSEFGINHQFAVFNNGQIILWKNDVYKLRKSSESKDFFLRSVCPELQLLYSTKNLGEEVMLNAILKKTSAANGNKKHSNKAKTTKGDYSTF